MVMAGSAGDVALVEGETGRRLTYGALQATIERAVECWDLVPGKVVVVATANNLSTAVAALAIQHAGATVLLADPAVDDRRWSDLLARYGPDLVVGRSPSSDAPTHEADDVLPNAWEQSVSGPIPAPESSVLLGTSGSTGSPKFVRLGRRGVEANAASIAAALHIEAGDVALANLPLHYSYGLSVLHSHLHAGARVVVTALGAVQRQLWDIVRRENITSIPGVPYSYEMYRRAGLASLELPSLRVLTQAGGAMAIERVREFHDVIAARGGSLYIMYGQTEATARMAVLDPDDLPEHIGSAGAAIPGGSFHIKDPDDAGHGEVIYVGPNVMLGYAESRADLAAVDELQGVLPTGDVGWLDVDERLWLTGRLKRIAKVFGTRVNLDDVERLVDAGAAIAAVAGDDRVVVFLEEGGSMAPNELRKALAAGLRTVVHGVMVVPVDKLPRSANGKVRYQELPDVG